MPSSVASPILRTEYLYETASFPSCHASTLAETPDGIVAAYFGGTKERHPDVCIWISRRIDGKWTEPAMAADGVDGETRHPTWNPVLHRLPNGKLMLFYKVGPSPSTWWGMVKTSSDNGVTWSAATRLPEGILGPIKNKPITLADGAILSPTSSEAPESSWRVYFERSEDGGETWTATPFVENRSEVAGEIKAIQPSVLKHPDGRLQAIGRTKTSDKTFSTWSTDGGRSWSPLELIDVLNPNSGTDAVTLRDGRHLLVYNNSAFVKGTKGRVPLNVAISKDGVHWTMVLTLETEPPGQYSYPCVIQTSDGLVHIAYTWKRERIKYVVLDPEKFNILPENNGKTTSPGVNVPHTIDV